MANIAKVFQGCLIHSLGFGRLEVIENGGIGIDEAGKIAFVAKTPAELASNLSSFNFPTSSVVDIGKKFIIPGFVDTHCHAPQYVFTGTGTGVPLMDWLDKFTFNYESQYKEVEFANNVYSKVVRRLLKNGTTTVSYFATIHLEATKTLHSICASLGQRALIGKVCMNVNSPAHYIEESALKSIEDTEKFIEYCKAQDNHLVQPTITPRFAITCDHELMTGLGHLAEKHHTHIQSHISENKKEIEFVHELFPGKSYAQVYADHGLLNEKTVMAHAVHLTDEEMQLFKKTGASISHCPTSNLSMFSGLFHVKRAIKAGVPVGLGTDVSGGYSPSMLDAIRQTLAVASAIQATATNEDQQNAGLKFDEAFHLATLGGAEALAMKDEIGNFVVGKSFDALVVDPTVENSPIDVFKHDTTIQIFEKYLHLGDDRNVEQVYVQGKKIVDKKAPEVFCGV